MTALNSEGLEKAREAVGTIPGAALWNAVETAITAYLSALPPVDGLEVVAWKMPGAKVTLGKAGWAFMTRHENPEDYEPGQYEALQADIAAAIPLVTLSQASSVIAGMKARVDELEALADRLKLEAKLHAGEARAANSTIHAIYQVLSGAAGESGNWNGTEPARRYVAAAEARISSLEEQNKRIQRKLDLFEATVSFTRRWAIEKDGNGTSAEERLSAIANHPGVKGIQNRRSQWLTR